MSVIFICCREKWIPEIRSQSKKVPIVLVGTQSDLRADAKTLVGLRHSKEHPIQESEARKLAHSLGGCYRCQHQHCYKITRTQVVKHMLSPAPWPKITSKRYLTMPSWRVWGRGRKGRGKKERRRRNVQYCDCGTLGHHFAHIRCDTRPSLV